MKDLLSVIFVFIINCNTIFGQNIYGIVIDEKDNSPLAYVNIGVEGKDIGTVSDTMGRYNLLLDPEFDDEMLLFTCIGYLPFSIKISELKKATSKSILMKKNYYELDRIEIKPKIVKSQTLGVITRNRSFQGIDTTKRLGFEYGILMKIKKSAVIKKVNINIAECTYDTIFYRLNIYKALEEMNFENILTAPIYISISKDQIKDKISIDLQSYNIVVDGDFLVALEHVKNLGPGYLTFCFSFTHKMYIRRTSQGKWEKFRFGISISVDADVEK